MTDWNEAEALSLAQAEQRRSGIKVTGWTKADGKTLWMENDGEPMFREGHLKDIGTCRAIHLTGTLPEPLTDRWTKAPGFEYLESISNDQRAYYVSQTNGVQVRVDITSDPCNPWIIYLLIHHPKHRAGPRSQWIAYDSVYRREDIAGVLDRIKQMKECR